MPPFKAELLTKWSHRPQLLSKVYPLSYPEMDTIPDPPGAISWSIVFLRAEGISSMAFFTGGRERVEYRAGGVGFNWSH